TDGSVGYAELTTLLQQGNVHRALVKNRSGGWVEATLDSVTDSASAARLDSPDDFRLALLDSPAKDAYPICGAICIVFQAKGAGERREELLTFMRSAWERSRRRSDLSFRHARSASFPRRAISTCSSRVPPYRPARSPCPRTLHKPGRWVQRRLGLPR